MTTPTLDAMIFTAPVIRHLRACSEGFENQAKAAAGRGEPERERLAREQSQQYRQALAYAEAHAAPQADDSVDALTTHLYGSA